MSHASIAEKTGQGRKLMAPFLCAGFPEPGLTLPLMEALAEAGADLIEVGLPYSDPLADGPVLQAAAQRALGASHRLAETFAALRAFTGAHPEVPVFLMSYANPLLALGPERLAREVAAAGVAGLLVPDLPQAAEGLLGPDLPPRIPFATLTTPAERLEALQGSGAPFLYAVSVLGVTGARAEVEDRTLAFLAQARRLTKLPVLAGFGVSSPAQAAAMAAVCDGVIVGSALAQALDGIADPVAAAKTFLEPFRAALDAVEAPCS